MLQNLYNKIDRLLSLDSSGPWWWRIIGGAISLALLFAVIFLLRR